MPRQRFRPGGDSKLFTARSVQNTATASSVIASESRTWQTDIGNVRHLGIAGKRLHAVGTPELPGLSVEEPARLFCFFDDAGGQKRAGVLVGRGAGGMLLKEVTAYIALSEA